MNDQSKKDEDKTDHELLIELKVILCNHLKHHERWEKFFLGVVGALTIALLIKSFGL